MRIPPLPHLALDGAAVDFRYARKLDMHRHVSSGPSAYEPDVLSILLCLLGSHERSRFINIGANIGYFPLIVKQLFGDRVDVHAYEPMPELVERLNEAQRRNKVDFRVSDIALADFEGTAPFHLSARSDTSNSLNPNFRPAKEVIEVTVSTLDAEFPAAGGTDHRDDRFATEATVLLIDTESTEPAVLRGALGYIGRVRPAIICEVLAGRTEDDLSAIMHQIDYSAYALTDDGPELRAKVVGDRTYEHRDWVFLPSAAPAPDQACFAETMRILRETD